MKPVAYTEICKREALGDLGVAPEVSRGSAPLGVKGRSPPEAGRFSIAFFVKLCNIIVLLLRATPIFIRLF